jgi:hypothetical protein
MKSPGSYPERHESSNGPLKTEWPIQAAWTLLDSAFAIYARPSRPRALTRMKAQLEDA